MCYQNDITFKITFKNNRTMEKKEFAFKGSVINGFVMLVLVLAAFIGGVASAIDSFRLLDDAQNG